MKKYIVVFAVLMVGNLGNSPVWADAPSGGPQGGSGGRGPGMMQGEWKQKLGLNDDQAQKLQAAMAAHRTAMMNIRQQKRQDMEKLRGQLQGGAVDPQIELTLSELSGMDKSMQAENIQFRETLAGFLTPKQRAQMLVHMMGRGRHPQMGGRPPQGVVNQPAQRAPGSPDKGDMDDKADEGGE